MTQEQLDANASQHQANGNHELRLVVSIIDEIAETDPERPYAYVPRTSKAADGWTPVTFRRLANAVNRAARVVHEKVKADSDDEFPTVGYVGPNDIRYIIIVLAAVKAGCKALLVSPRNSIEGQLSLFERTNCQHFWYSELLQLPVRAWLLERPMKTYIVPHESEWLDSDAPAFAYNKTFADAQWDPMVVLHTSGSTGIPKPIIVRQGSCSLHDTVRHLPEVAGSRLSWVEFSARSKRMFAPLPLFHAAGMLGLLLPLPVFYGTAVALPLADQPLTAQSITEGLRHSGSESVMMAPSILEDMSVDEESVRELKKLQFVVFGGGPLSPVSGERLRLSGVTLNNIISTTEFIPYAVYWQSSQERWAYFVFNSEAMGIDWQEHDRDSGIYEMVIKRKHPTLPMDQPVFYTFPELKEWRTGDLYKAHPTAPDNWLHCGRADNVIVFSNGEKLNPVTAEDTLVGHGKIKGAIVVGQGRFQAALLLEPVEHPASDHEKQALIDEVWPLVELANKETVAHGRIARHLVALSDPAIPFPRASKGTVQRGLAVRAYMEHINELYERVDEENAAELHLSSIDGVAQSLVGLLVEKLGIEDLDADTDIFSLGVDSLQVLSLSRSLRAALTAYPDVDVSPAAIYGSPTPGLLATYLYSACNGVQQDRRSRELALAQELVSKYTAKLPAPTKQQPPCDEAQTVLLTGSTGSLGAYLLDELCRNPRVASVMALNRGADGGESRQPGINAARGLTTDFAKVTFIGADLSLPQLGLDAKTYQRLLSTADRIVHNAWPVNFNLSVSSFEPHIRGVRHLVDFAVAAAKQAPVVFLSTVGTAMRWNQDTPVPERQLTDLQLADMGYGLSKHVSSLILDAAAAQSGVVAAAVIRVGQVAGPKGAKGKWNPQEYLPSLVASSVHLGVLPDSLGAGDVVDWVPIEDVAGIILDVAGISQTKDVTDISGYFHCVNPKTLPWSELAAGIAAHYGIKLVGLHEWISALEASATGQNLDRNPGVKLLDTYRTFAQSNAHVYFDMRRTMGASQTAASMQAVTPSMMRNWCAQWELS